MADSRSNLVRARLCRGLLSLAAVAALAPALAPGQDRPTRPAATQPVEEAAATEQEWGQLAAFMAKYSPSKWMVVRRAPDGGKLKQGILRRYRQLQVVAQADPERYALELKAVGIEDRIYACLRDIQAGQ